MHYIIYSPVYGYLYKTWRIGKSELYSDWCFNKKAAKRFGKADEANRLIQNVFKGEACGVMEINSNPFSRLFLPKQNTSTLLKKLFRRMMYSVRFKSMVHLNE